MQYKEYRRKHGNTVYITRYPKYQKRYKKKFQKKSRKTLLELMIDSILRYLESRINREIDSLMKSVEKRFGVSRYRKSE